MTARRLAAAAAALLVWGGPGATGAAAGPATLSVWEAGAWREFWRSDRAPARWSGPDTTVARALAWQPLYPGLEWTTLRLACGAPTWRARLIVARLDPRLLDLSLTMDLTRSDMRPDWSIDKAPDDAVLAVNAGQFTGAMPWGWVVIDGRQRLGPGRGPLASAVAIDAKGGVRWSHADSMTASTDIELGFQSYPTLLAGGAVPGPLRTAGHGVSHAHRDTRLALGDTRDGRILIAMTRFDAMGEAAQAVPLGPTTPEMAAIMGALGAHDAVMLDGGISAQMLLRDPAVEEPMRWPGLRRVPLALIAKPRGDPANRSTVSPAGR